MIDAPSPRLSLVTLGVRDLPRAAAFYAGLGFGRKVRSAGDEVAFFDAGGAVLALYPWDLLAADALLEAEPRPAAFRGTALAWNCASSDAVDAALAKAVGLGARLLKPAQQVFWGGYCGYFADLDQHPWEVAYNPHFRLGENGLVILPE